MTTPPLFLSMVAAGFSRRFFSVLDREKNVDRRMNLTRGLKTAATICF
jgi:hypothetical protein